MSHLEQLPRHRALVHSCEDCEDCERVVRTVKFVRVVGSVIVKASDCTDAHEVE